VQTPPPGPPQLQTPNPYAQDPGIAAALSLANPTADQVQMSQNQSSPSLQRLSTPTKSSSAAPPPAAGSGQLNTAGPVWVTVPIDQVSLAKGQGTVTPTYAAGQGYEIPPTAAAGRPPV